MARQADYPTIIQKNWLQFLFVVEATALKQQISKVYLHILTKEASYHIYTSQWPVTDVAAPPVKANFCA